MQYENLHQLIASSRSSRQYFLSLPVPVQQKLHAVGAEISTAEALHRYAAVLRAPNCRTNGFPCP